MEEGIVCEYLGHLFLEVEIFVAFDGLVIFYTFGVEFDEVANDLGRWGIGQLELYLIIEYELSEVVRK